MKEMAMFDWNHDGKKDYVDTAIEMMPKINAFLQQRTSDIVSMDTTIQTLVDMMRGVEI